MVFIATVLEQLNRDTVVVNCQDLNITNATAKISTCSGVLPQYSIDDTVIVGLENRDSSKLVVLGSISNNKLSSSSILSSTVKVNSNVVSVNYPSIGQISTQEFSCLQNLTTDLSQYFLRKDKENSDRTNDLISINTKISKLIFDTDSKVSDKDELENSIEIVNDSLGTLDSQSEINLLGKLNNSL